jgi:hypothetical protein
LIYLLFERGKKRKRAAPLLDTPSRGGENLRGGSAPSLLLLPSPDRKNSVWQDNTGWRGDTGVRYLFDIQLESLQSAVLYWEKSRKIEGELTTWKKNGRK